jgi:tetratricopeptide (TPR) repeat protein/predicted Ser/Thr protein kinase
MATSDDKKASSAEATETEPLGLVPRRLDPARAVKLDSDPSSREQRRVQGIPDRVGRFIPLKVLGQGGMGVVYAAYDPDLDRKVALKLMLATGESADLEAGRARLLREAQAMARVSHPHVIPVFEVGTWGEQVFVAMEFVDGGTLRSWLEERPRSWREVLEKFLAAGQGLAAAHAAGVVHRDFKPANVLVSSGGRVYVTDFGLARRVSAPPLEELVARREPLAKPGGTPALEEPLTEQGVVLGTPNYMSPEQFRGEVLDARSDQFSFCAALYRALYNARPFDPVRMSEAAERRASERAQADAPEQATVNLRPGGGAAPAPLIQEPPREAKVPAWVRSTVMRGLSLHPDGRFPSMEALLEALSQERRQAKSRRWVGAGALAGMALLGVGGVTYWQDQVCAGAERPMAEVWGAGTRQKVESAFRATGSPMAQEMFHRASRVLDQYTASWAWQSTEACEATRVRQVQTEALLSQQVVCLERRRKDLQALVKVLAEVDAKGVEKSLDAVHALPSPRDCADLEALSEQQARPADPERRAELERIEGQLAEIKALLNMSRYPVALERVQQLAPRVLATGYLPMVAELRFHEGWLQALLGKKEEGARLLEQAIYDAEAGRADRLEISILDKLLFVEGERGRFEEAERWARLGEATVKRLGSEPVLESELLVNRANVALMRGQPQEARKLLLQARTLQEQVLEPGHPKRARATFTLGVTLLHMGETEQAATMLEEALQQTQAAVGSLHLNTAQRHHMLSMALREKKDFARALEHAQASVTIHKALLSADHVKIAVALDEQGMSLLGLARYAEALRVYEEALAGKRKGLPPGHDDLHYSYDGVGQALLGLGRTREAIEALRQALTFTGVPPHMLGESGFALARALWQEGRHEEARAEAARARERFTQAGRTGRAADVEAWVSSLRR